MPEHKRIQQSKKSDTIFQKQATLVSQTPVSNSNPFSIIQRAKINPKSLTHADVMQLQRTIGNRAVAQLLSGIVNSSTTQQETVQRQEIPEEEEPLQGKIIEPIQRQEIPEEEEPLQGKMAKTIQLQEIPEEEQLQGKMIETVQCQEIPEEEEPLQGKMRGTIQRQEIPEEEESLQTKSENNTGMSDNLKAGVESLSGINMSDVRVHYNSDKPAVVGALAYTQGTNIHIAPGQETHLPHEAWHVVQQYQGRVKPTIQAKEVSINDDFALEREADVMGMKAMQMTLSDQVAIRSISLQRRKRAASPFLFCAAAPVVQRVVFPNMNAMWAAVHPLYNLANIAQNSALSALYDSAAAQLPNTDFVQVPGTSPQITSTPLAPQLYRIDWDTAANLGVDNDYFAGAVIHELAHAASSQQYTRHGANANELIWANMNLPAAVGPVNPANGLAPNQLAALQRQIQTIDQNWGDLETIAQTDLNNGNLTSLQHNHVYNRIQRARSQAFLHNDTVLGDVLYYLLAKNRSNTDTYAFATRMLKEANDRRQNGFWSDPGTEVRRVDSQAWWFQLWEW